MALAPPYTFSACGTIHVLYVITMGFFTPHAPQSLTDACVEPTPTNKSLQIASPEFVLIRLP